MISLLPPHVVFMNAHGRERRDAPASYLSNMDAMHPRAVAAPAFTVNSLAMIGRQRTLWRAFLRYGASKGKSEAEITLLIKPGFPTLLPFTFLRKGFLMPRCLRRGWMNHLGRGFDARAQDS
jgi:hypothetical protein